MEQSRREWSRTHAELTAALSAADARARDLADQLAVVKAALPVGHEMHHMHDDGNKKITQSLTTSTAIYYLCTFYI